MKTVFVLEQRLMNGTVTLQTVDDIFLSRELAEKCMNVLTEANKNLPYKVVNSIKECQLFETEDDCVCLKEKIETDNNKPHVEDGFSVVNNIADIGFDSIVTK